MQLWLDVVDIQRLYLTVSKINMHMSYNNISKVVCISYF